MVLEDRRSWYVVYGVDRNTREFVWLYNMYARTPEKAVEYARFEFERTTGLIRRLYTMEQAHAVPLHKVESARQFHDFIDAQIPPPKAVQNSRAA